MKKLLLITLFLCCCVSGWAEEVASDGAPRTDLNAKQRDENVALPRDKSKVDIQKQPTPTWPRPYKPSEEIRAGSSVPFPVDI